MALVKTITFVELWAIVAVDIVGAPVLAPSYWFASSFVGWGPRNPIDTVARYLESISQDSVRAIRYPFTGVSGAAAATGGNRQSSSAPTASRQALLRAGTGKRHSGVATHRGGSTSRATKHNETPKTGTESRSTRRHASSRDD